MKSGKQTVKKLNSVSSYFWEDGLPVARMGGVHKCVYSYLKEESHSDIVELANIHLRD